MRTDFLFGLLGLMAMLSGCNSDQSVKPVEESQRGESCAATNDCAGGLVCVGQRCVQDEVPVSKTAKFCFAVECKEAADCCVAPNWSAPSADICASYQEQCDLDPLYCTTYESYCVCPYTCSEDGQCVPIAAGCTDDTDCLTSYQPYCSVGQCVQCTADSQCTTEGYTCIDGACQEPCTKNEQCLVLETCQSGRCEYTGCTSDRQCILYTGDAASKCTKEKTCATPCASNAECSSKGKGYICENDVCTFIGCETADDCRAYLGVQYSTSTVECRELESGEIAPTGASVY